MKKSKLSLLAVAAMALMFTACNPETPEVDPDAGKTDQTEQEEKKDSETEEKDTDDKDSEDKDSEKKDDEDKDSKKEDENPPATLYVGTWVNAAGSKKVLFTADGKFKWAEKDTSSGNSLVTAMYIKGTYTVSENTISATGTNISFENEDESWMTFAEFKEFLLTMEVDAASIDAMISVYSNIQWTYTATETSLSLSNTTLGQDTFTKSTDTDVTIEVETNPLENYVYKPAPQITLPDSVSPEAFPFAYGTRYMLSNNKYIIFNANGKAIYGSKTSNGNAQEYKYVPDYELAYTVDTENKYIYTKRTKISYSASRDQSELKSYSELIEFYKNAFSSKEGLLTNLLTDYMKDYVLYYMYYYENGEPEQEPSTEQFNEFAATKTDDDIYKAFIYYTCLFELGMEKEAAENVTFAQFANLMMNAQEEYLLTEFSMICKFSYSYNETSNVMTLTREFVDNFSMNNLFPRSSVYLISEDGKLILSEYGLQLQGSDTKWQYYGYSSHTDSEITFNYSDDDGSKSITVPYTFTAPTSKNDVILKITLNGTEYKMKYNTNEYNSYNFYKINNFSNNSTSD